MQDSSTAKTIIEDNFTPYPQRPEKLYSGNNPELRYIAAIEFGEQGKKRKLKVDSLQLTNMTIEMEDYFMKLIRRKIDMGYRDAKVMTMTFQGITMVIALESELGSQERVKVYFTPEDEIDRDELKNINDLSEDLVLIQESGYVPFSTRNTEEEIRNKDFFNSKLTQFRNYDKKFQNSQAA